jgi:hypothetical protein
MKCPPHQDSCFEQFGPQLGVLLCGGLEEEHSWKKGTGGKPLEMSCGYEQNNIALASKGIIISISTRLPFLL